jgi:hypothetical protein
MNASFLGGICADNHVLLFADRNAFAYGAIKITDGISLKYIQKA